MSDIKNEIILNLGNADAPVDQEPKIIDTIHVLKQGTLSDWNNTSSGTKPFIPKRGEILLVTNSQGCFKIGNGVNTFSELPWGSIVKIEDGKSVLNLDGILIKPERIESATGKIKSLQIIDELSSPAIRTTNLYSNTIDLTESENGWIMTKLLQVGSNKDNNILQLYNDYISFKEGEDFTTITREDAAKLKSYSSTNGFEFRPLPSKPEYFTNGAYLENIIENDNLTGYNVKYYYNGKITEMGKIDINSTIAPGSELNLSKINISYSGIDNEKETTIANFKWKKSQDDIYNCLSVGTYNLADTFYSGILIGTYENDIKKKRIFNVIDNKKIAMWNFNENGIGSDISISSSNETPGNETQLNGKEGKITLFRRYTAYDGTNKHTNKELWLSDLTSDALLNRFYPVGSLYWSLNDTNPGTFMGGTWQRLLTDGGFPYIIGTSENYSGNTYTDKWDIDNFPIRHHTHDFCSHNGNLSYTFSWGISSGLSQPVSMINGKSNSMVSMHCNENTNELITSQDTWNKTSGVTNRPTNALPYPPHITVFCWKRTG